jgi:hypothetical protein
MATGTGNTTINFGAAPGTNNTSINITGLATFVDTDSAEAWIMGNDSTSDHNAYEHMIAPITLRTSSPVTGTGFTINATTEYRLTGTFKVRYVWAT